MRSRRGSTIPRYRSLSASRGCLTLGSRRFAMMGTTMGEGERAEAVRKRRAAMLFAISMVVAVAMVVGTAIFKQDHGRIAPGWAIAFVGVFLLAVFARWRFACRVSDEGELRNNVGALAAGGAAHALVSLSWYFLWLVG